MRADAALADRRQAVRSAARAWKRAGTIDAATLTKIEAAYPDDRRRLGPIFRIVAFGFAFFALNAFFGLISLCTANSRAFGFVCLLFAFVLAAGTEILIGPLRRADSGLETATGLLALIYILVGLGFLTARMVDSERTVITAILISTAPAPRRSA